MELSVIWVIALIVFVVLEAVTYQLVSIWFAVGAIGALAALGMGFGFNVQMIVFLVISAAMLLLLRPISMRLLKKEKHKTNADSLVGKEVSITENVNNGEGRGRGKINGMYWSVRSADGRSIPRDSKAVVERIEGVKLIVKYNREEDV